ncbi:MAG: polysaccharide deacetylase family protein [Planctomycetales bacterium]|nr:polysaccharide deacetylase family protein [Planctomycetales bacterium]
MNEHSHKCNDEREPAAQPPGKGHLRACVEDVGMRTAGQLGVGLNRLLGSRAGRALGIVTYHRVSPVVDGLSKPLHNVTPEVFREQIVGLLRRGFTAWPLRRAIRFSNEGRFLPPRTFVVTFDDGYESVYLHAWPVLRELRVPATIFLNTAFVDSDLPFPCDAWGMRYEGFAPPSTYRPLRDDQCQEMLDTQLIEIGAHTHTHQDFRRRPAEFRDDLRENLRELKNRYGIEKPTFAFPYGTPHAGFTGPELVAVARKMELQCALSTESVLVIPGTDPFRWGRFNAFPWDTGATLSAKLSGWYSWAPKLKQRISGQSAPSAFQSDQTMEMATS